MVAPGGAHDAPSHLRLNRGDMPTDIPPIGHYDNTIAGRTTDDGRRTTGRWRKASKSNQSGGCIELAPAADGGVAIRDSKNPNGPVLFYTPLEFRLFIGAVKACEFDELLADA